MGIKGQKAWNKTSVNADRLRELYINQRKTAKEIAVILQISRDVVYRRLRELGVPRRSSAEAHKGRRPIASLLAGSVPRMRSSSSKPSCCGSSRRTGYYVRNWKESTGVGILSKGAGRGV
ncbi:MAG: hypothetical protein C4293_02710 [Nitrospiraceae bacterium]